MKQSQTRGLGRGLSALIADSSSNSSQQGGAGVLDLPISSMIAGKYQPRHFFDETSLAELAKSIKANGVIQPIVVRRSEGGYEIIAGERRWRACKLAGITTAPAIIMNIDDSHALEISIVENIQREDLKVTEQAQSYKRLIDEFGYTQDALAEKLGISRSHVANLIRLLSLSEEILHYLDVGDISMGHARAVANLDSSTARAVIDQVRKHHLNVRDTEAMVRKYTAEPKLKAAEQGSEEQDKEIDIVMLEKFLRDSLGMQVDIKLKGAAGALSIKFGTLKDLDIIVSRLSRSKLESST